MVWIALLVGIIIIAGLAYYAGSLIGQLRKQRRQQAQAIAKRNANLFESIRTIALAMQQGQCALSEGALRIAVLLDHLVLPETQAQERLFAQRYPAIHDMFERIKYMPTHDARKKFPRQEIRKMDAEREGYEVELETAIQQDVTQLLTWVRSQQA